jgi:hypothetical protein
VSNSRAVFVAALMMVATGAANPIAAQDIGWVVPTDLLTQLEVSEESRRHAVEGLLVGLGVGTLASLWAIDFSRACDGSQDYTGICAATVGLSALGGGLAGILVGSLMRTDRWVAVPLS